MSDTVPLGSAPLLAVDGFSVRLRLPYGELHACENVSFDNASLIMELDLVKGREYVSADQNKTEETPISVIHWEKTVGSGLLSGCASCTF